MKSIPTSQFRRMMPSLVMVFFGQSVRADVLEAQYASSNSYTFKLVNMPDFDQRRSETTGILGLPNGGMYYCVPTATMNVLAYVAKHGYPTVNPGDANWQLPSQYNLATGALALLGNFMSTDPSSGTSAGDALDGTLTFIGNANAILTVSSFSSTGDWSPKIYEIAQHAVQGKLVAFTYGRYPYITTLGDGTVIVGARAGGHRVTLVSAQAGGNVIKIGVRDPADDPDADWNPDWPYQQSSFSTRLFENAQNRTVTNFSWSKQMTAMIYPPTNERIALIDSMMVIGLKYGLTFDTSGPQPTIQMIQPQQLLNHVNPPPLSQSFPLLAGTLRDAIMGPDLSEILYALNPTVGNTQVAMFNPATGQHSVVIDDLATAYRLAFGRKRELYILTFSIPDFAPSKVLCVNVDSGQVNDITATRDIGPWCGAIAYDDATDKVLVLDGTNRMIYKLSAGLPAGEPLGGQPIPPSVPLHPNFGTMAVNPADGRIWFATPSSPLIFNVEPGIVRSINIGAQSITSIDFDDAGNLFVTADGQVKEFKHVGPNPDDWRLAENPYFGGVATQNRILVSRSRTNFDPLTYPSSQWYNVHPDLLEVFAPAPVMIDCPGDTNDDQVVNVIDLLAVINNWGALPPNVANVDYSGPVNVGDLLLVINSWGNCP